MTTIEDRRKKLARFGREFLGLDERAAVHTLEGSRAERRRIHRRQIDVDIGIRVV